MKYLIYISIFFLFVGMSHEAWGQGQVPESFPEAHTNLLCNKEAFLQAAASAPDLQEREQFYAQMLGILSELGEYRNKFLQTHHSGNLIDLFPTAYYHTTLSEMLNLVRNDFEQPVAKMRQLIYFYEAYRYNRKNWDNGFPDQVEPHWLAHFQKIETLQQFEPGCTAVGIALSTGITAHVVYDLPRAIQAAVSESRQKGISLGALERDFNKTDAIFGNTTAQVVNDMEQCVYCPKNELKKSIELTKAWYGGLVRWAFEQWTDVPSYTDTQVKELRKTAWDQGVSTEEIYGPHGAPLPAQSTLKSAEGVFLQSGSKICTEDRPASISMFLFDVSGSMSSNNKIGQAKASALSTLQTLQRSTKEQEIQPLVSVYVFSGGCSPESIREILPLTNDLSRAEQAIQQEVPRPGGGTPIPQAINRAEEIMRSYLNSEGQHTEGKIIFLSDGVSSCGTIRPKEIYSTGTKLPQNPWQDSPSGIAQITFTYYTVGFDLEPGSEAERDLQYIARLSGGAYYNAQDEYQLTRAFQKVHRNYTPISASQKTSFSLYSEARNAILLKDYKNAYGLWKRYLKSNETDYTALYNMGLTCEANNMYKNAATYYRLASQYTPYTEYKAAWDSLARVMTEDFDSYNAYQIKIIKSDYAFLQQFWESLFNTPNQRVAAQFVGFLEEKQDYYDNLPEVLEEDAPWLEELSQEFADNLRSIGKQSRSKDFDRNAISHLTQPITQLETILKRLGEL